MASKLVAGILRILYGILMFVIGKNVNICYMGIYVTC